MPVIETIITQHAEEISFLWLLRGKAVHAPHYSLKDLAKLDNRVEAHIDGLRVAGDAGWEICKEFLGAGEAGEVFAAAVLAFESSDEERIRMVIEVAEEKPETCRGLVSALGWLSWQEVEIHIRKLLAAESLPLHRAGLAACVAHRQDPGTPLIDALRNDDPVVRAQALQTVGELGRKDLIPFLQDNMTSEDDLCRYSAAWSTALLGDMGKASAAVLKPFVTMNFSRRKDAMKIALRRMPPSSALELQAELASQPDTMRLALIGAGVIGDPVLVPWLMERMMVPELARVAGESFTMITGVDIAYEDLEGKKPEGFEAGPTENPEDEDVSMDPDEDLPWPDPGLVPAWWARNKSALQDGARYLLGKPINLVNLQHVLRYGRQRQRAAAAIEMAIMNPGQPLFETRAPGFRQQRILGLN